MMRDILAERTFPIAELRLFASERSAGQACVERRRNRRRGRRHGELRRARHSVLLGGRFDLQGAGAQGRGGGRDRHRQQFGLARRSRRAAGRRRSEPRGAGRHSQGHRRQSQLHDHGRDAGAQAAPRRGRAQAAGRQHLSGGVGRAGLPAFASLPARLPRRPGPMSRRWPTAAVPSPCPSRTSGRCRSRSMSCR